MTLAALRTGIIAAGRYRLGSDLHYPEERPARDVEVGRFAIDVTPVTNAAFAAFVAATGWVTAAERAAPAGAGVFAPTDGPVPLNDARRWWRFTDGACWRHPRGPDSGLAGLEDHPVVQVALEDARAFAAWRGQRLPTEAEWEAAARGGLEAAEYAWGAEFEPGGQLMANVWTGAFPWWFARGPAAGTTPVGTYPANAFGLHDMIGNVWEWTETPMAPAGRCCVPDSAGALMALKGGSFLCTAEYCERYRPAARIGVTAETAMQHIGFRCVSDVAD